ncbi:gluconate:H+ symporter [Pullulanibacillus sp. KACC 23026]|uniref:GntT/GntP/DsdX family permease n=1 Tax=Pullulanibacillus sp. KACC 23026 TaxID=3028315 RepID=UPI0023B131DB|nr:gluconate:H+ symporter [Pullulanibacillus sp. KACC 23026]WEG11948.1 gluconate:H+ symporter [Pullulanibacillus sp. KACC 23026]
MSQSYLLVIAFLSIFLLLLLIIKAKLHAFAALLLVSLVLGIASGMPLDTIINSFKKGIGDTLGFVAIIVGLGAMFGQILEVSGGGEGLAEKMIGLFGEKRAPLALGLAGFIVAIPVFFEVGFIILVPIIYNLTKKTKRSLLFYGLPLLAGLSVAHNYIPPTPGPLAVADLIGVKLGWVILFGSLAGLPAMLIAGPLFGTFIASKIDVQIPDYIPIEEKPASIDPPSYLLVVSLILVPIGLILINTFSSAIFPQNSTVREILTFIGHPFTALIITTLLAFYFLGIKKGFSAQQVQLIATKALEPAGIIILVIGAGGVFKQILIDSGIGNILAELVDYSPLPPILLSFLVAAGVRIAQGSSTVAMITAGGLISPVISSWHMTQPELGLIVIAIASGSTILSHVNDSGFWLINRYFGMNIPDTVKSWTLMETIISLSGFIMVCLIYSLIN